MAINPPVDATQTPEWAALQKHYDEDRKSTRLNSSQTCALPIFVYAVRAGPVPSA